MHIKEIDRPCHIIVTRGIQLATYRKRLGKWQVQIRIKDKPAISKTFPTKELARAWAITKERQLLSSDSFELPTPSAPLKEILLRYKDEITPYKKSSYSETYRISALLKSKIASLNTDSISKEDVAKHRDLRLRLVSKSTVRRELVLLRHILNVATHEWGYRSLCGLFDNIKFPKEAHHRVRRVSKDEIDAMWHALANQRNKNYLKAAQLALETGMRRSEILQLKVDDLQHDVIELKESKSGHPRLVPLTARSREILMDSLSKDKDELIFKIKPNALRLAWERARVKAGVNDLRFHDLRHEAISRMLEDGLSVAEVAAVSGHRDYRTLFKYAHLDMKRITKKLDNR